MPGNKKKLPELNAAPMADIAFLLLIFFLVVTTFDTDKGIQRKLPPMPEGEPPEVDINQRNVFIVLVNAADELLVEGEPMDVDRLQEETKEFIVNPQNRQDLAESPKEAVISLKNDRGTSYDMYIQVQNELTAAYNEIRNEYSQQEWGVAYEALQEAAGDENETAKKRLKEVKEKYPMKISEAEPEKTGG